MTGYNELRRLAEAEVIRLAEQALASPVGQVRTHFRREAAEWAAIAVALRAIAQEDGL